MKINNANLDDLGKDINDPIEEIDENAETLMGLSRTLAMTNAIALSALKKFKTNSFVLMYKTVRFHLRF